MKYPLGPYPNTEIAVASHLPPDGRCLAVAFTVVVVVPLAGKTTDPLSKKDALAALVRLKKEAERKLTDRTFEIAQGQFALGVVNLPTGEETVVDIKLELPEYRTGEEIQ